MTPKKESKRHNIGFGQAADHTAEKLLEILWSVHPDISHSLVSLIQQMMIMVRGAYAGEVALNEHCNDMIDIVAVDPATFWFRRKVEKYRLVP